MEKLEMLLQQMSEQMNNARIRGEAQLNNQHRARIELENKLATAERRISSRQLAQDPEIAFLAYLSTTVHLSLGQTIVFDKVVTNIDSTHSLGGYSPVTGVFTAPVDGIYVFSATLVEHEGSISAYVIFLDNRLVVKLSLNSASHLWYSTSVKAVLSLLKGKIVTVRDDMNGDNYLEGSFYSMGKTMFSGFLLQHYLAVAPIIG